MDKKLKGQVFTEFEIVDKILNEVQYNGKDKKTILDPACGNGNFLVQIVKRIIKNSPKEKLKENLSYVYGWDIDEKYLNEAKQRLDKLVYPLKINWNLEKKDALLLKDNIFNTQKFDFIVGNPPYIRIQNLNPKQKEYIQNNFKFCKKGSTDIFIAFFELAFSLLNKNGVCGFITPNSYFSTETAKTLREEFVKKQNIIKIINYNSIQLFKKATTYSAITIFDLNKREHFLYQYANTKNDFTNFVIYFNQLKNKPFWSLTNKKIENGIKLKEIANISVGIQTLADKVFISKIDKVDKNFIYLNTHYKGVVKFEKKILKPILKISKLKNSNYKITEYIIFPYQNGKIIPEETLKTKYPLTYSYLLSLKDILDKRDKGKKNKVAWYAFGRHHSITNVFGEKIVFSPMNKKPNFIYIKDENIAVYSGYYIKSPYLAKLLPYLNSKELEEYIKINSRDLRGGWKSYNKKILDEFRITQWT